MRVGLHDSDKTGFPNLALMKISAWHKSRGDTVVRPAVLRLRAQRGADGGAEGAGALGEPQGDFQNGGNICGIPRTQAFMSRGTAPASGRGEMLRQSFFVCN